MKRSRARGMSTGAPRRTGSLQVREFAREEERRVEVFLDRSVPPEMVEWFERAIECAAFPVLASHTEGNRRGLSFTAFRLLARRKRATPILFLCLRSGRA